MGGIISFILAMENGGQKKAWDSSTVIGLLVGFVLIWAAFGFWEYYNNDRAMLQRNVIGRRSVWQPSIFQFFFAAGYFVLLYYLPIYFQSVDNRTAISSGVLNLPLVLSLALGSTFAGVVVMKTGYAAPFMIVGVVLSTVSMGLIYTFDIGTSVATWIGYQTFYGFALGMTFQMGITIAQANANPEIMSSVTATVLCKLLHVYPRPIHITNNMTSSLPNHRRRLLDLSRTIWLREPHPDNARENRTRYQSRNGRRHGRDANQTRVSRGTSTRDCAGVHGGHQGYLDSGPCSDGYGLFAGRLRSKEEA